MSLFSLDPESESAIVKGIVYVMTLLGAVLMWLGKRTGGGALNDIEELKKASLLSVTRDEHMASQRIMLDRMDEGFKEMRIRFDNHIERRKS